MLSKRRIALTTLFAELAVMHAGSPRAQWRQCIGAGEKTATCVASIGSDIYVGTGCGLLRTTDHGKTWGIVNPELSSYFIRSLVVRRDTLYVVVGNNEQDGTGASGNLNNDEFGYEGLYRVTQGGRLWTKLELSLPSELVNYVAVYDSLLFCSSDQHFYISTNQGDRWMIADTSLMHTPSLNSFLGCAIDTAGGLILGKAPVPTVGEWWPALTTDGGVTWHLLPFRNTDYFEVTALYVLDSMLYCGVDDNVNSGGHSYAFRTSIQHAMRWIADTGAEYGYS